MTDLTEREREVLLLIAEGRGCREIAGQLGISEHTARKHRDNAVAKTHAGTQTAAAVRLRTNATA